KYQKFFKDTLLQVGMGQNNMQLTFYADNETIISGSEFQKLSAVRQEEWYTYLTENHLMRGLYLGLDESKTAVSKSKRKICFLQRLDFYGETENLLRIDIDYSNTLRRLENMNYDVDIYICKGDKIILSNGKDGSVGKEFEIFTEYDDIGYAEQMSTYGQELEIYVMNPKTGIVQDMLRHYPLILLLVLVNVLLPFFMVYCINHSFSERIRELSEVFERVEDDQLVEIRNVRGADEIGGAALDRATWDAITELFNNTVGRS
ncbi:MAG: hypothetical protein ACI4IV_01070, partial [Acutalibacteraceae bacterium]